MHKIKVLCAKPGENDDRRGRPKLRWCVELGNNIAQVGCRNWKINAQSRETWQKLTEEVTSHPRIQYQWKNKMAERNNIVPQLAFQLNSVPAAAESWDLKGCTLKVMGGFHSYQQFFETFFVAINNQ